METWGLGGTRGRHETRRWRCPTEARSRPRYQSRGRRRHETGGWGSPMETRAGCYETCGRGRPTEPGPGVESPARNPGPGATVEPAAAVESAVMMAADGCGCDRGCCEAEDGD